MAAVAPPAPSTPLPTSVLTADLFKRLHPLPTLTRFVQEGVRPDGRPVGQQATEQDVWREASVNVGALRPFLVFNISLERAAGDEVVLAMERRSNLVQMDEWSLESGQEQR